MKTIAYGFLCAGAALCALAAATAQSPDPAPLDVRHAMQRQVNPAIVAIWDVTNNALGDTGELDGALVTPEQWDQIAISAAALAAAGDGMAAAPRLIAADPGNWTTSEDEVPMAHVQESLDAAPDGYRAMASAFAQSARALEAAARARDAAQTGALVSGMDGECEACHSVYWYANY